MDTAKLPVLTLSKLTPTAFTGRPWADSIDYGAPIQGLTSGATELLLFDDQIAIRPFESRDLVELFDATRETLADLCAWMNWCHANYSLDDCSHFLACAAAEWQGGRAYNFAIIDQAEKLLCGSIALNRIEKDQGSANAGYWVRRTKIGKGIASRALRLAASFAFEELLLKRVEVVVPEGNSASGRVAQKAGAKLRAGLRRNVQLNQQSKSAAVYWLTTSP